MKKRISKENRVDGEVRIMKDDLIKGLRAEGFQVMRPDWPPYLLVDQMGTPTFAHLKRSGERLSGNQARTVNLLIKMGFNTLVVYQKKMRKLPDELVRVGGMARVELKEKVEPFDPIKHGEEIKDVTEADKRSQTEFDDVMESLNIASRKKDTSPPLTSTLESLPEEAPDLERKVREVTEDGQEVTNKG